MSHSIHSIIAMLDYAQLTCTFYVLPVHCALSYSSDKYYKGKIIILKYKLLNRKFFILFMTISA